MQPGYRPPAGERWNVNVPAVIGVVFVFMIGVVVWVVTSSDADDAAAPVRPPPISSSVPSDPVGTASAGTQAASPPTTSPTPLPNTSPPTQPPATSTSPSTTASTTSPPTTAPAPPTTAPGATQGAVPGDLAVPGRPMQRPPCDGAFITVLASAIGAQATDESVAAVLDDHAGANYLRTDQTCPSLRADVDGEPIYVVYLGPFVVESDACQARTEGPEGAYARQLSDDVGPDHSVTCP